MSSDPAPWAGRPVAIVHDWFQGYHGSERVVEALSRSPQRAGDLAAAAGVPAPTMSKHLRVLLAAGIVTDERGARDARVRVFRLRRESVVAVRAWLDQVQAHWDEQLRAFKRPARQRPARGA